MANRKDAGDAYEEIFGAGSDLSDVEDDDLQTAQADYGRMHEDEDTGPSAAAEAEAVMAEEFADTDDDEDGDYRQTEAGEANKLPSFRKDANAAPKAPREPGAEKIKKPKKKQRPVDEVDENAPPLPLDPAAERAARLDAILSNKKKKLPKKRKAGEEDLDEMADEEVYRLRQAMDGAVEADREAIQEGRPAIEKLKLLNDVISVLRKPHLETTILEADILTQIRRWLEPVGKNMPAVNIQRELLASLAKMDIETSQLKASELGKVVRFYTKHPKLEPGVKRQADQLVMVWMRPIIRRSAAARDRVVQRAEPRDNPSQRRAAPRPTAQAKAPERDIGRRHASIPQAISTTYTIAPTPNLSNSDATAPKSNSRFKSMKARLDSSKSDARRM